MSTSTPKTVPTQASVADFIAAQPDAARRADRQVLQQLITASVAAMAPRRIDPGQPAKPAGPSPNKKETKT